MCASRLFTYFISCIFNSHLCYAIELWSAVGLTEINKILIFQKRAIRIISGAFYRSHCLLLANNHNLFFVHDVINIALYVFKYKVFSNKVRKCVVELFIKLSAYSHKQLKNTQ